jgi:hypothetical protein
VSIELTWPHPTIAQVKIGERSCLSPLSSWQDGCCFLFLGHQVMTSQPSELLHMDIVGPARVCSFGGCGMRLWSVMTFLSILGCSL